MDPHVPYRTVPTVRSGAQGQKHSVVPTVDYHDKRTAHCLLWLEAFRIEGRLVAF